MGIVLKECSGPDKKKQHQIQIPEGNKTGTTQFRNNARVTPIVFTCAPDDFSNSQVIFPRATALCRFYEWQ